MGLPASQPLLCCWLAGLMALMTSGEHLWTPPGDLNKENNPSWASCLLSAELIKPPCVCGGDKVLCSLPAIHVQ